MFPTRIPPSDFTLRAFEGHVKALSKEGGGLTSFSKSDLYGMLSGERADHMGYARELHRALCCCNPKAAEEYRDLLASDRDLVAHTTALPEGAGDKELKRLCDAMTSALLEDEDAKRDAMLRLHTFLSGRLQVYPMKAHIKNVG